MMLGAIEMGVGRPAVPVEVPVTSPTQQVQRR
jgi:hypothetical protein